MRADSLTMRLYRRAWHAYNDGWDMEYHDPQTACDIIQMFFWGIMASLFHWLDDHEVAVRRVGAVIGSPFRFWMALVISVLLIGLSDALISGILQHGFAGIMIGFLHFCQGLLRMAIETAMAMAVGALGLICVLAITIVYRMLNQPFDRLGLVQGLIELVTTIGSGLWGLAHRVCVTIRIEPAREQTL